MNQHPFSLPKQLTPTRETSLPYLEELHQRYGLEVYPEDPFVGVFHIRDNVWAMYAPCTHAVGDNWLYLIEGPEKALFIDNGYGIGDLRALGEKLTGKPVISAVTHYHGDHAGGCPQWDEIYCHEYCADMLHQQMEHYEEWWNSFNHVGEAQHRPYYTEKDKIPYRPYTPLRLPNHFLINLGGDYDIELIHTGGHSPGLSCFLDRKSRILYTGDAFFESRVKGLGVGLNGARPGTLHPESMSISYYYKQVEALAARIGEFDFAMSGHGYIDSPARIVTDVFAALKAVIENPDGYDDVIEGHTGKTYIKSGGIADVLYKPEVVRKNLEEYPL